MKRYGSVIELRKEAIPEYKRIHTAVWPEVLTMIAACNIRNYSIFLRQMPDGKHYLFSYFEYCGEDFKADQAKMAADPNTQRWWEVTNPMQKPFEGNAPGDWWAPMEEVFHTE